MVVVVAALLLPQFNDSTFKLCLYIDNIHITTVASVTISPGCSVGVVAITSALHAEGHVFNPRTE